MPLKKSAKVGFVTSGTRKMRKKVYDFLFLAHSNIYGGMGLAVMAFDKCPCSDIQTAPFAPHSF